MKIPVVLLLLLGPLAACRADTVRLTINGPDGKPVVGAKVRSLEVKMMGEVFTVNDYTTDANGLVTIESKNTIINEPRDAKPDQSMMVARVVAPGLAATVVQVKAGDNTFALPKGSSLEGVALDQSNKPVAKAELLISSFPFYTTMARGDRPMGAKERMPDDLALRTTTDEQGRWKFESLPVEGKVDIEAKDARFKREVYSIDVTQHNATLRLVQGSTVKGRLLKPDGTPAVGIRITANGPFEDIVTDAQGRFEVTGIGGDSVRLQALPFRQQLSFMVPPKQVAGLKGGEVRDIGDWKTETGTKLKGRVVDVATRKPVANANIYASSQENGGNAQSDKEGAFELLVPGTVSGLSVGADGYVSYWSGEVPRARNGVIDVGEVTLKAGQKLSGVIVDEGGKPVSQINLYATAATGNRTWTPSTNGEGKFDFGALEAGTYTLKADGLEFVENTTVKVEADKAPAPLRLTIKNSAGQGGTHQITGRVVDGEGKAVTDAKIVLQLQLPGGGYGILNVDSGPDGNFKSSATGFISDVRVQSLTHPNFLRDQEKATSKEGDWSVDLIVQKQGTLRGRVVDSAGKAVKGAFVATEKGDEKPVATDENGAFTLEGVALRNATLLATDGASLATVAVQGEGNALEVALPAVAPIEDKAALADQLLGQGRLDDSWKENWAVLGSKRLSQLLDNGARIGPNFDRTTFLQELAHREPKTFLELEPELSARVTPDQRPEFDRLRMLARANSGDDALREEARDWLATEQNAKRTVSPQTVTRLLGLAQVANRLDKEESALWLDYAAQLAEQVDPTEYTWTWAELVARISPDALLLLSENWSVANRMSLIAQAMRTWNEDGSLEAGQQAWEALQKLSAEGEKNPGNNQLPVEQRNQVRARYAQLLARTDPKAALAMVDSIPEYERGRVLVAIAREAARLKKVEVAKEALTMLFAMRTTDAETSARGAGIAEEFDSTFAATLWPQAYSQVISRSPVDSGDGWSPTIASYARERAGKWAGESRILLEREWSKRLAQVGKRAPDQWDQNSRNMQEIAEAIAHLSPRRAVEMAEKITDTDQLRAQTRAKVAVVLLRSSQTPKP